MAQLLQSPWSNQFAQLIERAERSLVLCAPYITRLPCERIVNVVGRLKRSSSLEVSILTDLSRDNLISGYTDPVALRALCDALPKTTIKFLPSLHAKVYVADSSCAIVTSGNLTDGAMFRNYEYGVWFDDDASVKRIRQDIQNYTALGSPVAEAQLAAFATIAVELRELDKELRKSSAKRLRDEFKRRLVLAETSILQVRAAGKTPHAIFREAILYLLRHGPLATPDIHAAVQGIHPDLCDDAIDRVIDGQHFGKKWKHAVRTAQAHLQRSGDIRRIGDKWSLAR